MEDRSSSVTQSTTQALGHPVRASLLRLLSCRSTLSAKQALHLRVSPGSLSLSQVNYHLGVLDRDGLVEPATALTSDGLPFRFTDKGRDALTLIGEPSAD